MLKLLRSLVLLLVAAFLPPLAFAQTTPCDAAPSTAFFVVPPTGVQFIFPYATVDHDGVVSYKLTFRNAANEAQRGEQTTPKANVTLLGQTATAGVGCYSIPVVLPAALPRGIPLLASLTATSANTALSSAEGPRTGPFGAPLGAPAVRPVAVPPAP